MIGWVHYKGKTELHPVLCWYRSSVNGAHRVLTATGYRWLAEFVVPLDTEAEVAALLLQGFTMYPPDPPAFTLQTKSLVSHLKVDRK